MTHYDVCNECHRLTTQGLVCDTCVEVYVAHAEDDQAISDMAAASDSHTLPESDARFQGFQLDNPLA